MGTEARSGRWPRRPVRSGIVAAVTALLLGACGGGVSGPEVGEGSDGVAVPPLCDDLEDLDLATEDDGAARNGADEQDERATNGADEPDEHATDGAGDPDERATDGGDAPDERATRAPDRRVDPMGDVASWAEREAADHYAGVWLSATAGAPVIAFTDDLASYRDEIHDRFGTEWLVVEATYTDAQLRDLQERIVEEQMQATTRQEPAPGTVTAVGLRTPVNRVAVSLLDADEERLADLGERYDADAICVEAEPIPEEQDAQPARWEPAPDADLSPQSTSIDVLVNEVGCASGEPADGRIAEPEVAYGDREVVVTIRVVPAPGPQTCPSNPDTPFTVALEEPLGERPLLDGAHEPPLEPNLDRDPPRNDGEREGAAES